MIRFKLSFGGRLGLGGGIDTFVCGFVGLDSLTRKVKSRVQHEDPTWIM